jgi:hypothetical protein
MSAEGPSLSTASGWLSSVFQGTSFVVSALWVQLHTDHPGPAGTANVATNNTRKDCTSSFGTDPTDDGSGHAQIINDAVVGAWTAVPATETYTHVTFWNASTSGTFVGSGVISADGSVTSGDNFTLDVGDVTATLPIAA